MRNRRDAPFMSAVGSLLLLALAGCDDAGTPDQPTMVKPDKGRTAFFHRPETLAAIRATSASSPLIVMLSSDPWAAVIGSDSPVFALYSDGTTIFRSKSGYRAMKMDEAHKRRFLDAFDRRNLSPMSGYCVASDWTDQPDNSLLIYTGNVPFTIGIYGRLDDASVRSRLPASVVDAFDDLHKFSAANARPWLPETIELMVSPYEYAPGMSIIWPARWPALDAPSTLRRGDSYSIFLQSSELPTLRSFLASRREKGAIEIDGKKWSARLHLPFPHETLWMAPATP